MHPGPMNRGVEISSEIADGSRSLILDQVTNGVAVRMAVLYLLAGGSHTSRTKRNSPAKKQKRERNSGMKLLIANGYVIDPAQQVNTGGEAC